MEEVAAVVKRGPGRPPKSKPEVAVEAVKPPSHKMTAKPNWESMDNTWEDTPDRLKILQSEWPEGMSMQWVTVSVFGQETSQHRSTFERNGWTPVHQADFDGKFNGRFMPRNAPGEINVEGLVLMARPKEITEKFQHQDKLRAREQISIKEAALRGGDIPNVGFDTQHKSALQTNKINRSYEKIEVPND